MKVKTCFNCKTEKSVTCFASSNASKSPDKLSIVCLDCAAVLTPKERTRLETSWWRKNNATKAEQQRIKSHFSRSYNITPDQYQAILEEQNFVCAICGEQPTVIYKSGRVQALSIDHDHATGAVRGLLCGSCNQGLGLFRDDPKLLTAAITYLNKHQR